MKIGLLEITKIIEDCKATGHDVTVRDIAYTLLMEHFEDSTVAYTALFGKVSDEEIKKFDSGKKIKFLKKYINTNYLKSESATKSKSKMSDLSFEENKEQLIKNLETIQKMKDSGELDAKDFIKLDIEIRTKLNDKFSVSEKQDDQRVIVYKKFNDICVCGREIYRPTREDIIEELKKEYDIIPKQINQEDSYESENTTDD